MSGEVWLNDCMTNNATAAKIQNKLTAASNSELINTLLQVEHFGAKDKATMKVRMWVAEELEARFDVAAEMDAWADDVSDNALTYVEALLAAVLTRMAA